MLGALEDVRLTAGLAVGDVSAYVFFGRWRARSRFISFGNPGLVQHEEHLLLVITVNNLSLRGICGDIP